MTPAGVVCNFNSRNWKILQDHRQSRALQRW